MNKIKRRNFLILGASALAALVIPTSRAKSAYLSSPTQNMLRGKQERSLSFYNLHTGESLKTTYWFKGRYIQESLNDIKKIMRDYRTGTTKPVDKDLLDQLLAIQGKLDTYAQVQLFSGYRSPKTNEMLRKNSGGVAKKSLHMLGKAVDISIPGRELFMIKRAAVSLNAGGVGYYPESGFVHIDTGDVRQW